jgi:hypothetical protein
MIAGTLLQRLPYNLRESQPLYTESSAAMNYPMVGRDAGPWVDLASAVRGLSIRHSLSLWHLHSLGMAHVCGIDR